MKEYPTQATNGSRVVTVLPASMQRLFVEACHAEGGHQGRDKTAELVGRRAYFPRWKTTVSDVCSQCVLCASYSNEKTPRFGAMQFMEVEAPMDRVAIDLTGPHPATSRGNQYILTMVDCFSRFLVAVPVRNKYATTIAKALNRNLFSKWGLCREILSDQGKEFDNKLLQTLCEQFGIRKLRTSGYRPSVNGRIERLHRSLNALFAKSIDEHHQNWDEIIDAIVAQYNGTVHRSTGFTPNHLMFGREAMTRLDLIMKPCLDASVPDSSRQDTPPSGRVRVRQRSKASKLQSTSSYVDNLHQRLAAVFKAARQKSLQAATKRKQAYDRTVKAKTFVVGQQVLLREEQCPSGLYNKWRLNYIGPFIIEKQLSPVNFRIKSLSGGGSRVVNVDRLRSCTKTFSRQKRRGASRSGRQLCINQQIDSGDFVNVPIRRSERIRSRGYGIRRRRWDSE